MAGTILVVDDDYTLAETLRDILEYEGYTVWTVHDEPSALAVLAAKVPDLVLLDLQLPGLTGLKVLEGRGAWSLGTVPIIILTASRPVPE